ncbi:hypothetical protein HDV00_005448, partial [Rhizophlyctis rosea]
MSSRNIHIKKPQEKQTSTANVVNDVEAFLAYCAGHGLHNNNVCSAVYLCLKSGKPSITASQASKYLAVTCHEVTRATADLLLLNIDYAIRVGTPLFSVEGLMKLAAHFERSASSQCISKCLLLYSEWSVTQLKQKEMEIQQEKEKTATLLGRLSNKYAAGERVHIMQNSLYGATQLYKVGRTRDLHKRLSTYNTGNPDGSVTIVYDRRCCDSKLVESMVHHVLDYYRSEDNREYFCCPLVQIRDALDHCIES